ncbi:MAG: PHP domain-containing protein [Spirochaetia bacterium]
MKVNTELHIHSCASPCGSLEMSPRRIAKEARKRNIRLIALTDHNTARNAPAFSVCCRKEGISGIYGLEVTSREEAHILTLFAELDAAREMGEKVEGSLPDLTRSPSPFGDQVYVDEDENILGEIPKSLFSATELSSEDILEAAHTLGGLVVPSHIDRPMFSIVIQLGFLPDLPFDAVECISPSCGGSTDTRGIPVITNSDAHYPEDIGTRYSTFEMEEPSFEGLREALRKLKEHSADAQEPWPGPGVL